VTRDETAWTWWTLTLAIAGRLAQKYRRHPGIRAGPARTRTHARIETWRPLVRTEIISKYGPCAESLLADSGRTSAHVRMGALARRTF
jgi:hypothetical protein